MTNEQINKLIALHVFQEDPLDCFILDYAGDIKAAWEVVEKLNGDYLNHNIFTNLSIVKGYEHLSRKVRYFCHYGMKRADNMVFAETAPMAICLAALKAVGVEI